ncbi:hypothetical protein QTN25_010666 [Entamoeba marina]
MSETPHISKVNLVDYYCKSTPGIKQNIVELDKLMNSFRGKRGQYEVTKINKEILNKRNSIIHGNTITSVIKEEEEIQENIIIKEEQENDIFSNNRKENITKKEEKTIIVNKVGIPYFWLKVLWESGIFLSYELSEDDIIALTYLIDIKVRRMTPRFETKTFTILNGIEYTFIFEENPYFTNTKFEIRLEWVTNEELIEIDDGYIEVISKSIDWKIDLIEINKNSFLMYLIQILLIMKIIVIFKQIFII